ncbi:hypothetical protein NLJ89_g9016 [Agrocybe chaxingu]|uniref:Uncharacterized protein n=1 Tax=Agrocybe chaxingu TaxID=84603 RepID=A0A9W8JWK1_9AGAR|nr:hypothetical protein NLJ89_g9016 [Agrocybe chaxingu]
MFVPFISEVHLRKGAQTIFPRKGGGGGGRGGGGGGRSSSSKGSSSSKSSSSSSSGSTVKDASSGGTFRASSSSNGGVPKSTIPQGQPFAGREVGGGTRSQVYGTSFYGSGYPGGGATRGVAGRGFPFIYYPIIWPVGLGPAYLYSSTEYGSMNDTKRPGGPLVQVAIYNSSAEPRFTYRVISDSDTGKSLYSTLTARCAKNSLRVDSPVAINSNGSVATLPSEAIQYYRASSVVLTLDGYNNTAIYDTTEPFDPSAPLPSGLNLSELGCINSTIGDTVLLAGGSAIRPQTTLTLLAFLLVWVFSHL